MVEKGYTHRVCDFNNPQVNDRPGSNYGNVHCLEGAFVITNIAMTTSAIVSLRLAGSEHPVDFFKAASYYLIWDYTPFAKKLALGRIMKQCNNEMNKNQSNCLDESEMQVGTQVMSTVYHSMV